MKGKIFSSFIPYRVNNPYAANVMRLIEKQGIEVLPIKKCICNPVLLFKSKIFNFNWFETLSNDREFYGKIILIRLLKLFRKKIIYTIHNKQPHNCKNEKLSLKLMCELAKSADVIVGLCPDTNEVIDKIGMEYNEKLIIVPHPNYIFNYPILTEENYREKYHINENDIVFMFIGAVLPYKNIEMLIDIFKQVQNPMAKLLIVGRASDDVYRDSLSERARGVKNIICDFVYVPDEEIVNYYNTADIVILPYQKKSSLNSGAVYLSYSLKKTVICPDIGTMKSMLDTSFVYMYSYEDENQHMVQLNEAVSKAISDELTRPGTLKEYGCKAYEYIVNYHSDEAISEQYGVIYNNLIKR